MRSESLTKLSWFGDDDRYELELFHLKQLNGNLFYENVLEREKKNIPLDSLQSVKGSRRWSSLNSVQLESEKDRGEKAVHIIICFYTTASSVAYEKVWLVSEEGERVVSYVTDVSVTFNTVFHYQTSFLRLTCELFFKALIRVWTFCFFFIFKIIITYYYSDIHMMCIRLPICENFRFPSTQGSLLLVSVFIIHSQRLSFSFRAKKMGRYHQRVFGVHVRVCWSVYVFDLVHIIYIYCIKQQQTKNKKNKK